MLKVQPIKLFAGAALVVTLLVGAAWVHAAFVLTTTASVTATGTSSSTLSFSITGTSPTTSVSNYTTSGTSTSSSQSGFTVGDELNSQGSDVWEIELYFPSLGRGSIIDAIRGSSSCPCQVSSVTQPTSSTVQIAAANGITITSTPSMGYEKIVIGSSFQYNNYMPGVLPRDVFEHWQSASVFRYWGLVTPFALPSASGYSSYGSARLTRGGATYDGFGVYLHVTAETVSDPRPGIYFQFGWTPTSTYILFVAKTSLQDESAVVLPSGQVVPVSVAITNPSDCSSFSYAFNYPTATSVIYGPPSYAVGTACVGETFGPFHDDHGNSGTMWMLMGR